MILVRVELWSALTGQKTTLALMSICNSGARGTGALGDYEAKTFRGRSEPDLAAALVNDTVTRKGQVIGHPRKAEHIWNLVNKALTACGYKTV